MSFKQPPRAPRIEAEYNQGVACCQDEVEDCLGKARIEILYATEKDRQEIEQIIGETFLGIPYRMQNI